jgi:hypothetical protein
MDHKDKLEELHKESVSKLDEYVKTKESAKKEDHEKLEQAKKEWQSAWNKMMEALMVLERLEL